MYIRKWLNDDTGRAHIIIDARVAKAPVRTYDDTKSKSGLDLTGTKTGDTQRNIFTEVSIADCSRFVSLEFYCNGVESKPEAYLKKLNKRVKKLRILIDSLLKLEEIFLKEIKEVEALGKPVKKNK